MKRHWMSGLTMAVLAAAGLAAPAAAQSGAAVKVEIGPGTRLADALKRVAGDAGLNLVAPSALLAGRQAPELRADLPAMTAIERLLAGAPLRARLVEDTVLIEAVDGPFAVAAAEPAGREIVVTGTRIRGAAPAGASVISIDREAIERSGYATTTEILQSLPQNFLGSPSESNLGLSARNGNGSNLGYGSSIDLRGLGTASTLVLFDGNRPPLGGISGAFADLSLIPLSAIERVEVLADGASALYGSDAVAGVVNIRFRDRFEGAETRLRAGTADGDFEDYQAGQLLGARWDGGHVAAAYQFDHRGALAAADRAFARDDLRPFGGGDYRSDFSSPGTIVAANGQIFGIPAGQDGRALEPSDLIPGVANRTDHRRASDLLPRQETHSAFLSASQLLGGGLEAFARVHYAHRDFQVRSVLAGPTTATVTAANPFYVDPIGGGAPVRVRYDFSRDLGPETTLGTVEAYSGVLGLARDFGDWSVALQGGFGRQTENTRSINLPNRARLAAALAFLDPATAYNLFGDGGDTNPETVDFIRGSRSSRSRYRAYSGSVRADGPLLALPAGDLRLAVGGEYRDEGLVYRSFSDTRTLDGPVEDGPNHYPRPRQVTALYAELLAPLVGAANRMPGVERLDLSAAIRTEHYSDVGSTTNPKLGVSWAPLADLTLRGAWGTSFRAPSFDELLGSAASNYQPFLVPDPASPTGLATVLGLFGYADGIGPERAETWTLGFDLEPAAIAGLRLSATLFDIRYRDRIGTATFDVFNFLSDRARFGALIIDDPDPALVAAYYAAPTFNNPLGIAPGDIQAILEGRVLNLSSTHVRGIDGSLALIRSLWGGELGAELAGSYLFFQRQRLTETAPAFDVAGSFGNPVEFRGRGQLSWATDALSIAAALNHVDGYDYLVGAAARRAASWTTVDLQLGYRLGEGLRVALSATNLFDRAPPFVENVTPFSAIGYDAGAASPVGRLVSLQLVKRW